MLFIMETDTHPVREDIMRIYSIAALLFLGMSILPSSVFANDLEESAIEARQGEMQLRAFNAGPLIAMAKGDIAYDADMAGTLANNLKVLLSLDNGRAWMQGTSNEDYPGESEALPAVWEADSEIGDRGERYAEAVNALAEVAGQGLDAMRPRVVDLGDACKACHDDYRED